MTAVPSSGLLLSGLIEYFYSCSFIALKSMKYKNGEMIIIGGKSIDKKYVIS